MIPARLARLTLNNIVNSKSSNLKLYGITLRNFTSQSKENVFRRSFRLRSKVVQGTTVNTTATLTDTPLRIGKGVLAGASAFGLLTLGYYGLGLSNQSGILDHSAAWPEYIKDRIRTTYEYFGASLGLTAASALAISKSPTLMGFATRTSFLSIFASFALVIGSGMLVRSIPYEPGKLGSKQLAWALHSGLIGALVAPITLLGGPLLTRAAIYTAGVVGGLSVIAATAPSEKFLNMGAPLAIGLGVVFASSIGGMFLPPTTRLGLSLYSMSIYGGLILFSMFLLYDTQRIVKKAELSMRFDPVNESISIYLDVLNIFMRIATILAHGGNRKR